jgi:hypothetical protein
MNVVQDLKNIEQRVERLLARARRAVAPEQANDRELFTLANLSIVIEAGQAFEEHRATWYNGAVTPLVVRRMQVNVGTFFPSQNIYLESLKLPSGWNGAFDFRWYYTVGRRQSYYSRAVPVSGNILAGNERGQCLNLKTPLVIMPGEQIQFVVRPLMFIGSNTRQVNFVLVGYREDDIA